MRCGFVAGVLALLANALKSIFRNSSMAASASSSFVWVRRERCGPCFPLGGRRGSSVRGRLLSCRGLRARRAESRRFSGRDAARAALRELLFRTGVGLQSFGKCAPRCSWPETQMLLLGEESGWWLLPLDKLLSRCFGLPAAGVRRIGETRFFGVRLDGPGSAPYLCRRLDFVFPLPKSHFSNSEPTSSNSCVIL